MSAYNGQRVKILLIKLAKAYRRHSVRMAAHQDFHAHVNRIKQNIVPKKSFDINSEIDQLKRKVEYIIQIEKGMHSPGSPHVQDRLAALEKKLDIIMQSKDEKEQHLDELSRKITVKLEADKAVMNELERKLLLLQRKIIEHKLKKGKYPKELDDLSERLDVTKTAIHRIKG